MIALVDVINVQYTTGSTRTVQAQLVADTVADLPQPSGLPGYLLTIGSVCDVIQDSARYVMRSSGVWVQQLHDVSADTYTRAQIDAALATKQGTLTFDSSPMEGSTNPVYSGGIFQAVRYAYVLGSGIQDNTDLFTLDIGRYYKAVNVNTLINAPPDLGSNAFYLDVVNTISAARKKLLLYPATLSTAGTFYTCLQTGAGFGAWYKFAGTQI